MKRKDLLIVALCLTLPCMARAQQPTESATLPVISLTARASGMLPITKKALGNYNLFGYDVGVYLHDKFYFGYAQFQNITFSEVRKNNPDPGSIRVREYSMEVGYKQKLLSPLYLYFGINGGYSYVQWKYFFSNGIDSVETLRNEKTGSVFVSPSVKLGIKVQRYVSLEFGLNYHYYFKDVSKNWASTSNLNGVMGILSVVGHYPL